MFQVALLESLRKAGVLTESQIRGIVSFNDLYTLLVSTGTIPPISEEERKVCNKVDKIMTDYSTSFEVKLNRINELIDSVDSASLKQVLSRVVELGRKL